MRILMVDDSAPDRNLCRILLHEAISGDVQFEEARNAKLGLIRCREHMPDCLLLDYKLPDMSGIEFLSELNSSSGILPCAVVMLTGLGNERVASEAMRAGAQDYLIKDQITGPGLVLAIHKAVEKVKLLSALSSERDRLASSLAEKEVLLTEVHHRVKNNLQVIASLLRLQANTMEEGRAAEALRESQHRVEAMALIHEQLYQSKDAKEIDMSEQLRRLTESLVHSWAIDENRIRWSVDLEPLSMELNRAIPLGLIVNELISNVLKHAFPSGSGEFQVTGRRDNGNIRLEVKDNGAGFRLGIDARDPKTIGLQIVAILVKQLKGTFEIVNEGGAACRLTIPFQGGRDAVEKHAGKNDSAKNHIQSAGGRR